MHYAFWMHKLNDGQKLRDNYFYLIFAEAFSSSLFDELINSEPFEHLHHKFGTVISC